jgi:hypothetical protein
MNQEQITNVIFQIKQLQDQTNSVYWVAFIGMIASFLAAVVTGIFGLRQNIYRQKHEKQWQIFNKNLSIIETAVDACWRMIFNKFQLCSNPNDQIAQMNLFVLQKDVLYFESLLMIYGELKLAENLAKMREAIISISNAEFRKKWPEIYAQGRSYLIEFRKYIWSGITQDFNEFEGKLRQLKVSSPTNESFPTHLGAGTMGSVKLR